MKLRKNSTIIQVVFTLNKKANKEEDELYRKLGRDSSARKALFRSMLTSFFQYERIETTEAKRKNFAL